MATGPELGDLVGRLDGVLAVVTTASGGEQAGCLVGFHVQCSIDPPRYALWLSKANHTFRVGLHAQHFAVHFLQAGDLGLAEAFGTVSGDDTDKLAGVPWTAGPDGVPVLGQCSHRLVGRRVALLDEGSDHVCVVLEVTEITCDGELVPLRLSDAAHLAPGHEAKDRPTPASERAG